MSDRFSDRLDKLSRKLAEGSTRRGILRLLGVGALIAPVAALTADDAEARRNPRKKRDRTARQRQRERDRKQKQRERDRKRKQRQRNRKRNRCKTVGEICRVGQRCCGILETCAVDTVCL